MRLPQEPDDQLQEIKLTSSGHRTETKPELPLPLVFYLIRGKG